MPVTVPVVGSGQPVGVVYVPLPLTVDRLGVHQRGAAVSVNVIVPVGLKPPDSTAVSVKVTGDVPA